MGRNRRTATLVSVAVLALALPASLATPAGAAAQSAPVFQGTTDVHAKVGKAFSLTVQAVANPAAAITATTALPSGLTLVGGGGGQAVLSGTFGSSGTFVVGLEAVNALGKATEHLTFTVTIPVSSYCGQRTGAPTTTKVMVIYEENHSYSSIVGSPSAPRINAIARHCGAATNYRALTHPSLPNYLASTSGQSYASSPWTSDCGPTGHCVTSNNNIFNQVGPSRWKGYVESMSSNCSTSGPNVLARHNPAEYYTDLRATCAVDDVPLGTTKSGALRSDVNAGTLPAFATVTPNAVDDMHDGSIARGDAWLSQWMSIITSGPDYRSGHLTVLVVWDEGSGSGNVPSTVLMLAISPYVQNGVRSATGFTHYSLLKAAEDVAGVPELGAAASAHSLRSAFGF